jgi:hypothetical protein
MRALNLVCVLLVAALWAPALATGAPSSPWRQEDPAADVEMVFYGGLRAPAASVLRGYTSTDLRSLEIQDPGPSELIFRLKSTQGFKGLQTAQTIIVSDTVVHTINFGIPGTQLLGRFVVLERDQTPESAEPDFRVASVSFRLVGPSGATCTILGSPEVQWSIEDGVLVLPVQKGWMTTLFQPNSPPASCARAERIRAGELLTGIHVETKHSAWIVTIATHMEDRLPDTGFAPDFAIVHSSPPAEFLITYPPSRASLVKDELNRADVFLRNRLLTSADVRMSADGGAWHAQSTPQVHLPANNTTVASLWVTPRGDGPYASGLVTINASEPSRSDSASSATVRLVAGPPYGVAPNVFTVHGWSEHAAAFRGGAVVGAPFFLSTLAEDPLADDSKPMKMSVGNIGAVTAPTLTIQQRWDGLTSIPNPVRLLRNESVKIHVELDSPGEYKAFMYFTLSRDANYFSTQDTIAKGKQPVTLVEGRNVFDLEVPFSTFTAHDVLDGSDGSLHGLLEFKIDSESFAEAYAMTQAGRFLVYPKVSHVYVPMQRFDDILPPEGEPRIVLSSRGQGVGYINPGKERAFEFIIRNEETRAVEVRLGADGLKPGWSLRIAPSDRYKVPASSGLTVAAVLRAPGDVLETDGLTLRVIAKSASGTPLSSVRLTAHATQGEIDNVGTFVPGADALEHSLGGRAPGPAPWLVLLALPAMAVAARRR